MLQQVDGYEVDLSQCLGQGTFGRVYPCRKLDSTQFDMCCKAICIESLKKNQTEYEKTLREANILSELKEKSRSNENVVQFYHTTQVIFENQEHILLFMEKCDTDLKEQLKKTKVSVADAVNILKQIINGYRICYENSIVHRDIKPANILIKGNVYKLTDFGEGKIVKEIDKILQQTKSGTPIYQSPQMFRPSQEVCSAKTDIFSLGVMFYEILYSTLPFPLTRKGIEDFHNLLSQKLYNPPNVNHSNQPIGQQIIDLLKSMLIYNDNDRIGWKELFDHPLIKIVAQEQKDIKKFVMNEMKQNNVAFKPPQVIQLQRYGTLQGQKTNLQPMNGQQINQQIPQTSNQQINNIQNSFNQPNNIQANVIQSNKQIINQQIPSNLNQLNRQTIQNPNQQNPIQQNPIQQNPNQQNPIQQNPIFTYPNVSLQRSNQPIPQIPQNIPTVGMNNSTQIKTLDSYTLIVALKFLRNFMNSFEKYGNINSSVHEYVDNVVRICKQLLTQICYQILLKQNNQICEEQFKTLKTTQELQQVQIYIEYSQKAKEQSHNVSISDLGNQLKSIIEKVYQFFPFDKTKNYKESYVKFKINMKFIIQEQIKFTDLACCDFGTPNESYLY